MQVRRLVLLAAAVFSVTSLLWAGLVLAQGPRPFQEVFPNAKVEWELTLPNPYPNGQIVGCEDGFVLITNDRTHLYRYNAEGKKLWELSDIKRLPYGEGGKMIGGIWGALVSRDGRFVYVKRDAGYAPNAFEKYTEEQLNAGAGRKPYGEYFDAEGNSLWTRQEPPYLTKISPHGKYLMTERDEMADQADLVVVSGKDGSTLWERPRGFLAAEFVGDDKVALYSNARFYLFDAATGDTLRTVDLLPTFRQIGLRNIAHARISSSKDGRKIALILRMLGSKSGVISLNSQGDILWARGDIFSVSLAKVSESGKTVFVNGSRNSRLVDNDTGGDLWVQDTFFSYLMEKENLIHVTESLIIASGNMYPDRMSGTGFFDLGKNGKLQSLCKIKEIAIPVSSPSRTPQKAILVKKSRGKVDFLEVVFKNQKGGRTR